MTISNHINIDDLCKMPIAEIVALSSEKLALLQDAANEALRSAKTTCDWLEGAIALKYGDRAGMARTEAAKDTGTVRFDDGAVTVIADLPTRLADLSEPQVLTLIEAAVTGYQDALREYVAANSAADPEVPF